MNEWETLSSISDSAQYTPLQRKSLHVTFDRQSFAQYDLFQSAVVKGNENVVSYNQRFGTMYDFIIGKCSAGVPLCYTGGPVWSMAWAPLPAHIVEQYLAVASLRDMNQTIKADSPIEFPAMVQIWKFGSIDNIR